MLGQLALAVRFHPVVRQKLLVQLDFIRIRVKRHAPYVALDTYVLVRKISSQKIPLRLALSENTALSMKRLE